MARFQDDPSYRLLKTLVSVLLGLASLLGGWIIFNAEGFYSSTLFLVGTLMMPIGVFVVGNSLVDWRGARSEETALAYPHRKELERQDQAD